MTVKFVKSVSRLLTTKIVDPAIFAENKILLKCTISRELGFSPKLCSSLSEQHTMNQIRRGLHFEFELSFFNIAREELVSNLR